MKEKSELKAAEIAKDILYMPVTNGLSEASIAEGTRMILSFAAQFQDSSPIEGVTEAAEASRKQVQKNGEGYDFWVKNGMSMVKNGDTNVAFRHGFEKGANWQSNRLSQKEGELREALQLFIDDYETGHRKTTNYMISKAKEALKTKP